MLPLGGMASWLAEVALRVSRLVSSVWLVAAAVLLSAAWLAVAALWGFGEPWLTVLVVATSLITFVMLFLITNAQERDTRAIQLKLDELLRAIEGARDDHLVGLERKPEHELREVEEKLREAS